MSKQRSIVVADDSPVIRDLIREVLSFEDEYDLIETFEDGRDAVRWVTDGQAADIFIVDMRLPGLSGAATIHAVRRQLPDARIIAFSASAQQHSIDAAIEAGADSYLLKDARLDELLAAIGGVNSVPTLQSPAGEKPAAASPAAVEARSAPSRTSAEGRIVVAVVDDHELVRQATRLLLETDDEIEVLEFADGQSILDWSSAGGEADVTLVDMRLGDYRGETVLSALRAASPQMSLVIHSGSTQAEFNLDIAQLGVDAYLVKGAYGAAELVDTIRKLVATRQAD